MGKEKTRSVHHGRHNSTTEKSAKPETETGKNEKKRSPKKDQNVDPETGPILRITQIRSPENGTGNGTQKWRWGAQNSCARVSEKIKKRKHCISLCSESLHTDGLAHTKAHVPNAEAIVETPRQKIEKRTCAPPSVALPGCHVRRTACKSQSVLPSIALAAYPGPAPMRGLKS